MILDETPLVILLARCRVTSVDAAVHAASLMAAQPHECLRLSRKVDVLHWSAFPEL